MNLVNENQDENLSELEDRLREHWRLGRNIVIGWHRADRGINLLIVPYYFVEPLVTSTRRNFTLQKTLDKAPRDITSTSQLLKALFSGSRNVSRETVASLAKTFGVDPVFIGFRKTAGKEYPDADTIDEIMRRYSISFVEDRAAILIDIAGFSIQDPFMQTMQLNSLAYSINSAHSKLTTNAMQIDFARTTTGDGFYIWNRDSSMRGNMDLYYLLKFVLADNAIARHVSVGNCIPTLKTAFHIGDCYEFYQVEGLQPTVYNYIVGNVTIELARLMEQALPGQLLIGDFAIAAGHCAAAETAPAAKVGAIEFIHRLRSSLMNLNGVELSGEKINSIQCYLTGGKLGPDEYGVSKYIIVDKHGRKHLAYNAKTNIYRENGPPIYIGIQEGCINGLERV